MWGIPHPAFLRLLAMKAKPLNESSKPLPRKRFMAPSIITSGILSAMSLILAVNLFAADERIEKLPSDQRRWLEEDVVYIITDKERELFLSLGTVEERERFMIVFWDRRDTDTATLENEFKDEHYRRIAFANKQFGREGTRAGWKTDRGRYYIILGEPAERQRYDGQNEVVDCEIWFYAGEVELRMPARFNLLFYRENNIGEYTLYHPFGDGPEELLQAGFLLGANQNQAVEDHKEGQKSDWWIV